VPAGFAVPAAVAVGFLAIPLLGLLGQTPWRSLPAELTSPLVLQALRLSLVCSLGAVAVSVLLGLPLAYLLARVAFPGRNLVRALTTLPMVLPPVVGGVALLLAFGRRGLVGQWLDEAFGITLPFTTAGAILAEAFVAMPFRPLARGRRRAVLGAGAGGVRGHHHLRRQPARGHPDHAPGRLPGPGDRSHIGHRPQPHPAGDLAGRADRPAGPLVPDRMSRP
jgi:hypothetical protein